VHRPDHDADARALIGGIARELGLVATGGSDFHRPGGPFAPGDTGPTAPDPRALAVLLAD
jgi:hypothetical protein